MDLPICKKNRSINQRCHGKYNSHPHICLAPPCFILMPATRTATSADEPKKGTHPTKNKE